MAIKTKKQDVVWSYAGTITSMASGFLLLPLLLYFLSDDELGLWYIFVAISNLLALFEFGFSPTFARNIVYCLSGVQTISRQGVSANSEKCDINWHLLRCVFEATRIVYLVLSVLTLVLIAIVGTVYIAHISAHLSGLSHWIAWGCFCGAVFVNFLYLKYITYLRGVGDVAAENKARTFSRLLQIMLSAILMFMGFGLIGASIAYLLSGLSLGVFARFYLHKHSYVMDGMRSDCLPITKDEIYNVLSSIAFLSWRDGIVQIALYASTQGTSIVCSLFVSLADTGTYSLMLQLGTAVYRFAAAFAGAYFPMFQAAFAEQDGSLMRSIVERGISMYWLLYIVGVFGILVVVFPVLHIFKPEVSLDIGFFLILATYLALTEQHSLFCRFIVSTNRIPYMLGYLIAALLGVILSGLFCGAAHMGMWGLVLGQALSQLMYNNWRWPLFILKELDINYIQLMTAGLSYWKKKILGLFG